MTYFQFRSDKVCQFCKTEEGTDAIYGTTKSHYTCLECGSFYDYYSDKWTEWDKINKCKKDNNTNDKS